MSLAILERALELGLIFSILSLGVYISFRILNIPDLTVDGSFTTGAATCAVCTVQGHPILGLLLGFHSILTDKNENSCVIGRNLDHDRSLFHQS